MAAGEHTTTIAQHQRCPQVGGYQPVVPAHIQHRARPAQDRRQQVGVATQPAQVTGTERFPVPDQPGSGRIGQQLVVVHGDHDPRPVTTDPGCAASCGVVDDHRDQRISPALFRGQAGPGRVAFFQGGAPLRLGVGIQLGDPRFAVDQRQAAGEQDRPVTVPAEHQRPVPLRRLRLPLQPTLQGLISLRGRDLRQHLRGSLRQPVGVHVAAMLSSNASAWACWLSSNPSRPLSTVPIALAWFTLIRPAVAAFATSGCPARSRAWCNIPAASRFDNPPCIVNHDVVGVPACCNDSCAASALANRTADRAVNWEARPRANSRTLQPLPTPHQIGVERPKAHLDLVQHPPPGRPLLLHGTSQTPTTDNNRTRERRSVARGPSPSSAGVAVDVAADDRESDGRARVG